jgi:hypothetical protein
MTVHRAARLFSVIAEVASTSTDLATIEDMAQDEQ